MRILLSVNKENYLTILRSLFVISGQIVYENKYNIIKM